MIACQVSCIVHHVAVPIDCCAGAGLHGMYSCQSLVHAVAGMPRGLLEHD